MRPWQEIDVNRIPHLVSGPALRSEASAQQPYEQWAARPVAATSKHGHLEETMQSRGLSRRTMSTSPMTESEDRIKTPMTAPLFGSEPVTIPEGPRSAPELPSFEHKPRSKPIARLPNDHTGKHSTLCPTPACSKAESSDVSYNFGSKSSDYAPLNSLGSMPTCNITDQSHSHACRCYRHRLPRPSRFARLKSMLRDLFHDEPVSDADIEYIETSHWTEQ